MGFDPNDWRLMGQEEYLRDRSFLSRTYQPYSPTWEHEHCDFCGEKISLFEGAEHEGYVTLDNYLWVCKNCFQDFKDAFYFRLFDPETYRGRTFCQILSAECTSFMDGSVYPIRRVIDLCRNLKGCSILPCELLVTPFLVLVHPHDTRITAQLDSQRLTLPAADTTPEDFCSFVVVKLLELQESIHVEGNMQALCVRLEDLSDNGLPF